MTTLSAVIPCYNGAEFLAKAIESALGQTRAVGEVIVVDDASTDGSTEVAARYPVTLIRASRNGGPARARNLGIRASTGDVVAFLDADDWWEPGHCETVVTLLERFPEAGVAASAARFVGTREGRFTPHFPPGVPTDVFWQALRYAPIPQMAAMVRRSLLEEVGGYDEQLRRAQDFDLWIRLSRRTRFVCTHAETVRYRWHPAQLSTATLGSLAPMFESRRRMYETLVQERRLAVARRVRREIWLRWLIEATQAWRARDRAWMRQVLDLRAEVPQSPLPVRWLGRGAARGWSRLPGGVRGWLRRRTGWPAP